ERGARDLEERATRHPAVETDDRPPARPLRLDDARRLAVHEELRSDREPLRRLARLLDDERAVEAVRATHPSDRHPVSHRRGSRSTPPPRGATPAGTRSRRAPPRR